MIHSAKFYAMLIFLAGVLSYLSSLVVLEGAADEPYGRYRRSDAFMQVGVGTALMALWLVGGLAITVLVAMRRLSAWWLLSLLWVGICLFYLSESPIGYLEDLEKLVLEPAGIH
jgi:hypothetical protein